MRRILSIWFVILCTGIAVAQDDALQAILEKSGFRGGLAVWIEGDPAQAHALAEQQPGIVHMLYRDPAAVVAARSQPHPSNVYYDGWQGEALPYRDGVVNLLMMPDTGCQIPDAEVKRVLVPNGVSLILNQHSSIIHTFILPRPAELDEWPHYLRGPDNNAVSRDTVIAPPQGLQWQSGPTWSRHHERSNAMDAMVSSGGRVFYVLDEGSRAEALLPPRWMLVARDAFNGTLLWKVPLGFWTDYLNNYKYGSHSYLPRKLVALGDDVFVPIGENGPVSVLDAATGRARRVLEGTEGTYEMLCGGDTLYAVAMTNPERQHFVRNREPPGQRKLMAVDFVTGRIRWQKSLPSITKLTLTLGGGKLYYHNGESIAAIAPKDGAEIWGSEPVTADKSFLKRTSLAPTLVYADDRLMFSGGDRQMYCLGADDGHILWKADHQNSGHTSPEDLFVVGDQVWHARLDTIGPGKDSGPFVITDLKTGETLKEYYADIKAAWMHHRCHRAKATSKYYLASQMGVEFVDMTTGHWDLNHWVRGSCLYGIMPANGLLYNPIEPCQCYPTAKLNGLTALTPLSAYNPDAAQAMDPARLTKGVEYLSTPDTRHSPALRRSSESKGGTLDISSDWPTFRHDPERSGSTEMALPDALKPAWAAELGGRLSALTAAENKIFGAQKDRGRVFAIDAASGKTAWTFTAGGRVDSPPTCFAGRVYFGCADGRLYCLSANDGQMVWRYLAAPLDRRMVRYDRLESVWPLHGSTLIIDDPETGQPAVWALAGRNRFVDGGLFLSRLDAETGERLSLTVLGDTDPATGKELHELMRGRLLPTSSPDILAYVSGRVFMRNQVIEKDGSSAPLSYMDEMPSGSKGIHSSLEAGDLAAYLTAPNQIRHLFSPYGFLEDSFFHRTYWLYGQHLSMGFDYMGQHVPAGQILVCDEAKVYGFGRRAEDMHWRHGVGYRLFCSDKNPALQERKVPEKANERTYAFRQFATNWERPLPCLVRAMVKAGDRLVAAGLPHVADTSKAGYGGDLPEDVQSRLEDQAAAWNDERGGLLYILNASSGQTAFELKTDSQPVWDGMIAAYGKVFMATQNGRVICLGE